MAVDRSRMFTASSVPAAYVRFLAPYVFEPWARELIARGGPWPGATVLDVACGPGSVTRVVAAAVGEGGGVTGTDISPAMLDVARGFPPAPGSAPIEFVEGSALELPMPDSSFQFLLCQQGLQFFPDRAAAAGEFCRVLAPGGAALVSVWAAGRPFGLFGLIGEALRDDGMAEPYPRAFEPGTFLLDSDELEALFVAAGFTEVTVEQVELECRWPNADDAVRAVYGTPFGPSVSALAPADQESALSAIRARLGGGTDGVAVRTYANIVRAQR